jgi:hypothetical protein
MPLKRIRCLLATTALLLVTLAAVAKPAGAEAKPRITLKPNQTFEQTFPAPLPAGNAYPFFGNGPPDCATGDAAVYCDTFPLTLDVPPNDLNINFYSLSITLSWPTTNLIIPAVGNLAEDDLGLGLWDDPIVEDNDPPASCNPDDPLVNAALCDVTGPAGGAPGGDEAYIDTWVLVEEPIRFGMVPKRTGYSITVTNYAASSATYTLKVSLISASGSLSDLSIEGPKDLSVDQPAVFSTPAPLAPAPAAGAGLDLSALGLADLGPDSDLSRLGLTGEDNLDLNPADLIRRRGIQFRQPGDENAFWLWFWFVGLPVAGAGGAAVWFIRRRAALLSGG